jgi:hypothetical protein
MELPLGFTSATTALDRTESRNSESSGKVSTPPPTIGEAANFTFQEKWGLPVDVVYRLGMKFYRGFLPLFTFSFTPVLTLFAFTPTFLAARFIPLFLQKKTEKPLYTFPTRIE